MPQTCGIVCTGLYGNRGQKTKGQVDHPGREIYSYCTQPEALNRFCGHLPDGHDFNYCRQKSEKTKKVLCEMKKVIRTLDHAMPCDQWDTWPTYNNTTGPHRFNFYRPKGKPWDLKRVKSKELIGSQLYKNCDCIKRNGLQDDCPRFQCRGRGWCKEQPFPLCPPFTQVPRPVCDVDPYKVCPHRPWEHQPGYIPPKECPIDPLLVEVKESRDPCPKGTTCKVRCPNTGKEYSYNMTTVGEGDHLPDGMKNYKSGKVFKLTHATCNPPGVYPPK
ncbi:uncharacterized protein [Halyomorpha halys]|uniref:uncharacterized protein n=1 Tax=Halyomorpha halys TaxID=286706 RepID=UPI0006D4F087|nr:uncharacterized protein LOC106681191 [Halyomorpha halys]